MGEICQIISLKKAKRMTRFIRRTMTILALICMTGPAHSTFIFDHSTNILRGEGYMPPIVGGQPGLLGADRCQIKIVVDGQSYNKIWSPGSEPNCRFSPQEATLKWMLAQISGGITMTPIGAYQGANYIDLAYLAEWGNSWSTHGLDIKSGTSTACSVMGTITLEHGTLAENTAVGHMARNTATLMCNGEADVKLTVNPSNTKMTNGMNSRILVLGESSKKIKVGEGVTTIDISSELSGKPKQPGGATGSAVLQLEVQ
ncbi:hypothetical protein I5K94_22810 [Serratia marcescens]|nr:hypothetical protein [Serratia marcescens]